MTKPYIKKDNYSTYYYKDKEHTILHREDGPARDYFNGDKEWWVNGNRHRIGGPASEYKDCKRWFKNDKLHRIDGPAIEYSDGSKYWYLNDKEYSEEEHKRLVKMINFL